MIFLKITYEAIVQALDSMWGNKLRTFLSLLGITIGIFCIIAVKSAVDSLRDNIVSGFNELGTDVLYIERMPWNENPDENFWKYAKRPEPSYTDYEVIASKSKLASHSAFTVFTGGRTIKYKSTSVTNAFIMAPTFEYEQLQGVQFEKGRYFTKVEYETAANKVILGSKVADQLFSLVDPIGRSVSLFGQDYNVIGVLKSEGDNMFNFINFDDVIWLPFENARRFINVNDHSSVGKLLNVKAKPDVSLEELKGELTGILRAKRRLSPAIGDNFAINELSMLSQVLDSVFGVINLAGFMIGIFSLIVGMFSVANIMFVSVKERTSLIGVKKALGAKRFIILLEFLIEAVILCIIGGFIGLGLVWVVLKIVTVVFKFQMTLSFVNIMTGVITSIVVGIIAGILPAIRASALDPVVAMRS